MRTLIAILLLATLVVAGLAFWFKFDHGAPTAIVRMSTNLSGRQASFEIEAYSPGWPGLRSVRGTLTGGGQTRELFRREFPATSWFGSGVNVERIQLKKNLVELGVPEGDVKLQVDVETFGWQTGAPARSIVAEKAFRIDLTPPTVTLVSTQHNVRLGGVGVAVFVASGDTVRAGVAVGDYYFPATRGFFADPNALVAVFAIPQDLSELARATVHVEDAAGNVRTAELPVQIKPRKFPEREMVISDEFLQRKVPELVAINKLPPQPDLVKGYVFINSDYRKEGERQLKLTTAKSPPKPLWDGAFHRQSNAAPMSAFADRRVYKYKDEVIDRQTHLGYDLASLINAPVEATQNGIVVFAGNLGLYGNTVVLDHGLGVFSLYGHLNTIAVHVGQTVKTAQIVGQTGQTGLAGGDHLHYSIMIHGTHVDPIEWWDGKWIKDHVSAKLNLLPPSAVAPSPTASVAAPTPTGTNEQAHPG